MTQFNEVALEPFLTMALKGDWSGHAFTNFSSRFSSPIPETEFDGQPLTRDVIKRASQMSEREISSSWLTRAILAWGGLKFAAIAGVNKREAEIVAVVSEMRKGELSRKSAYREFMKLSGSGPFGLGPAYFTKLIFFACPAHDGYIMDQWTAKSANLLSTVQIVKLQGDRVVEKSEVVYESFCVFVEALAGALRPYHPQADGEYAEECMFAGSKRKRSADGTVERLPWRNYVRQNW